MEPSKYSAYQDFQWAVKLNRFSLDLIGLWPKSKQTSWEKRMCNLRALLLFSILLLLLIPSVHFLIRIYSDILLMMDNLQYTLVIIICMLKITFFWWKKTVVTSVIDMIANDWTKTKTPQERIMMIARARTARMIVTVTYVIIAGALFVTIGLPIFGYSTRYLTNITNADRLLPCPTYYIYDVAKSPQFELTFTSQAITMILGTMVYAGVVNFLSLAVFHICGQLDILRNRLIHMNAVANYIDVLRSLVIDHTRLFRAIAIVEDTYSTFFLILFTLFGTLCICYGFLLTNMLEDGYQISFSQLAYLITIVMNVYANMCMYCALGEFLTAQCDQIHYAVYCNEWYIMGPRNARSLVLLMVRTNKSLHLSAGKVFPLTMTTFCGIDFEWAVRLNRFSLELIGLWPNCERTTWERRMCNLRTLLVFLTVSTVIVIPALHSLMRIYSDIMLVIDNLQYTLPMTTCMLKIVIFWWKKEAVAPIIDMIADDWMKVRKSQEKMTMIARAQTARVIIIFGYGFMISGWIVTVILPMLGHSVRYLTNITDPGRPLPVQTYYIYDVTKSPQYEITFTFQAIAMFLCIMPYTGIDNFLSLLIFHISGQLDILNNRLMHLTMSDIANYNDNLRSCVKDHTRLLRTIAVVEDTFNTILLILFLYFGTLFACYGFVLMSMLTDGHHFSVSYLPYFISVVTNTFGHMCLYCVVGEILAAQCNRIHYAVYCNKWYTLDSRHARNLILPMAMTNKPYYLNIGKVFPLTMATFCNLLKTSAGYISVLLTTRNQSKS